MPYNGLVGLYTASMHIDGGLVYIVTTQRGGVTMSLMTIDGTPVDIVLSKSPDDEWIAFGRVYNGVLPGKETVDAKSFNRREAELLCMRQLERLIHTRTCGTE